MRRVIVVLFVLLQVSCASRLRSEDIVIYPGKSYEFLDMQRSDYSRIDLAISRIKLGRRSEALLVYKFEPADSREGLVLPRIRQRSENDFNNNSWLIFETRCGIGSCHLTVYEKIKGFSSGFDSPDDPRTWITAFSVPRVARADMDKWLYFVLASQYHIHSLTSK